MRRTLITPPSPIRNWIATLVMVLAIPALVVPTLIGIGSSALLTATPSTTPAGSAVELAGVGFSPGERVVVVIEDDVVAPRELRVDVEGSFSTAIWIPATTEPDAYRVEVRRSGSLPLGRMVIARLTLNVTASAGADDLTDPEPMQRQARELRANGHPFQASSTPEPSSAEVIDPPALEPATPEPTAPPATPPPPTPTPATPVPATPAPTPVPATPAPEPPTASGRAFFIAPGGSDDASGSIEAPWRSISRASAALGPGDVLYARGGTYTGQGGYNWATTARGTAAAPITFAAYPGEVPVFDGGWTIGNGLILADVGHVVVRGLKFTHYDDQWGGAPILLLRAHDIVIEGSTFIDNGRTAQQDHHIYVNSGCWNVVIRNNYMQGTPGAGVHIYHDPGPTNVVIAGNTMIGGYWGVVIGSSADRVSITENAFSGNVVNIDNGPGTNVSASGNSPNDIIN